MHTTPISLLDRLRRPGDQEAWSQFVKLYAPLLYHWVRRLGLHGQDSSDLVQDVFVTLVQKLPAFVYDRHQRFRGWLWVLTLNQWRARRRAQPPVAASEGALAGVMVADEIEALGEAEYRRHVAGRALKLMQADFLPTTWKAFWGCVALDQSAAEVATALGMTPAAVYAAKSRVLRRLRQELAGLIE